MITKFSEVLGRLKRHRSMYLFKDDYFVLVHFLIGYELALEEERLKLDIINFQSWFKQRIEKRNNVHWAIYIYEKMAFRDEAKAIELVFNLFEEYLENLSGEYMNDTFI
jgi:hypothetical protein